MIIFGTLFIAVGVAILADLELWPTLLVGFGLGLVITGVTGKWLGSMPWRSKK